MKTCNKCNIDKEINEFHKRSKDKYRSDCISCHKESMRNSYVKNKPKRKEYYLENKTEILNSQKTDSRKEYSKKYYELNRDIKKKYYEENKHNKIIDKENRREWAKKYYRMKKETDIMFILKQSIRSSVRKSLNKNGKKTSDILGCSFGDFKFYLESKFESWMTWSNRGLYNGDLSYGWDIDHIIPLSSAKNKEEVIKLNHYTNLQPLCSKVNRDIKRATI